MPICWHFWTGNVSKQAQGLTLSIITRNGENGENGNCDFPISFHYFAAAIVTTAKPLFGGGGGGRLPALILWRLQRHFPLNGGGGRCHQWQCTRQLSTPTAVIDLIVKKGRGWLDRANPAVKARLS